MDRELDFVNDRDQTGSRFKELDVGPFNAFVPSQYSSSFVKFFMPAGEVYNWAKSHLDLNLTFPATANFSNYLFMGRNMLIQSMSLQYDGNNFPVNMQDCRISSSVTTLPQLDYDLEYITRPQAVVATAPGALVLGGSPLPVSYQVGDPRCELIQPIKKPSGSMTSPLIGASMTYVGAAVAAAVPAALGAAGALVGYADGIPCLATGATTVAGNIVATCMGLPVLCNITTAAVAGVYPGVGLTTNMNLGTVVGYTVVSNNTNNVAGAVIGYIFANGLSIPVFGNGVAYAIGVVIGSATIQHVAVSVVSLVAANPAAGNTLGYCVNAQTGNTPFDAQTPGGASLIFDQTPNGGTPIPLAMDGSDSPCTVIGSGCNTHMAIRIRINLSDFRNTLLAVDRTMCWPRNANLYFTFAPTQYWGYSVPSAAGSPGVISQVGVTSLASVPLVQECVLRVAVEKSQPLRIACMAMTESGFSLNFPQVTTNAYPIQGNTMGTYSYNLESALGHSVLRIYTAILSTDVAANYLSPNNTIGYSGAAGVPTANVLVPTQYSTFQSYLGTELLQDQQLRPESCDDYRFLKKIIKGSALTSNLCFSNFSFFLDNFTGAGNSHKYDWGNCDKGGLPLIDANGRTIQYNYRVQITSTNGTRAQVWFIIVSQNTITISPMGVHIGAAAAR